MSKVAWQYSWHSHFIWFPGCGRQHNEQLPEGVHPLITGNREHVMVKCQRGTEVADVIKVINHLTFKTPMIILNYLGGSLQVEEGGRSVRVRGIQYEEDSCRPFLAEAKRDHEARKTGKGKQ